MSEQQLDFVPADDGEPPSARSERVNYQTGEVYEGSFSNYMSMVALTKNAEKVIADAHVLQGDVHTDSDITIHGQNATLRRHVVQASGRDEDGEIFEKNVEAYFYTETLPSGEFFHQAWNSSGVSLNLPHEFEDTITAAADLTDRLARAFPEKTPVPIKRRLASTLLRRLVLPL